MKRNPEIVRAILLQVEALPIGHSLASIKWDGDEDEDVIAEHVRLLKEANYIDARIIEGMSSRGVKQVKVYSINRLLNDGHDFLANAKNESVWKQARTLIQEKGGDVSLAVLKALLAKVAMQQFGLS
ncbi:MAG: DUF2513 domain-containing protein [Elainellaceae cyanobacterium]